MPSQPKYTLLTKQEKNFLIKGRTESLWMIIVLLGASVFAKVLLFNQLYTRKVEIGWWVLLPLLMGFLLLGGIIYSIKRYLNYQLDITSNHKYYVTGTIENKYSLRSKQGVMRHVIVVNHQKFIVPDALDEIDYDLKKSFVQKGDQVTIWFAPRTRTVFSLSSNNPYIH